MNDPILKATLTTLAILVLVSGGSHAQENHSSQRFAPNTDCGVNCLVVTCKLLGKKTDKKEMSTLAKLSPHGTNFQNLARAARQKGLYCRGVTWSMRQLSNWDKLAIAHWQNHFVLVNGFEGPQRLRVIDPPRMPFTMDAADFDSKWDGKLLLISDEPISVFAGLGRPYTVVTAALVILALATGLLCVVFSARRRSSHAEDTRAAPALLVIVPAMLLALAQSCSTKGQKDVKKPDAAESVLEVGHNRLSDYKIDFGRIRQSEKSKRVLILKNKGPQVVNIKGISTSCTCTAAILSKKRIKPEESAKVQITLDAAGLSGNVYKPCLVRFDNPDLKPIKIALNAFVYLPSARFVPGRLFFDKVLVGSSPQKGVNIANKGDRHAEWRITEVRTSSPLITVEYLPKYGQIRCRLTKDAAIGTIKEKLIVSIKDPNGLSRVEIPVRAQVVGPLTAKPSRLYLGNVQKNQLINAEFAISSLKEGLDYALSLAGNPKNLESFGQRDTTSQYSLQIRAPDRAGFFQGHISLKTGLKEQPLLDIPYAGFVLDQHPLARNMPEQYLRDKR